MSSPTGAPTPPPHLPSPPQVLSAQPSRRPSKTLLRSSPLADPSRQRRSSSGPSTGSPSSNSGRSSPNDLITGKLPQSRDRSRSRERPDQQSSRTLLEKASDALREKVLDRDRIWCSCGKNLKEDIVACDTKPHCPNHVSSDGYQHFSCAKYKLPNPRFVHGIDESLDDAFYCLDCVYDQMKEKSVKDSIEDKSSHMDVIPASLPLPSAKANRVNKVASPKSGIQNASVDHPRPAGQLNFPQQRQSSSADAIDHGLLLKLSKDLDNAESLVSLLLKNATLSANSNIDPKVLLLSMSSLAYATTALRNVSLTYETHGGRRALDQLLRRVNPGLVSRQREPVNEDNSMDCSESSSSFPIRGLANQGNTCSFVAALHLLSKIAEPYLADIEQYLSKRQQVAADFTVMVLKLILHILKRIELTALELSSFQNALWNSFPDGRHYHQSSTTRGPRRQMDVQNPLRPWLELLMTTLQGAMPRNYIVETTYYSVRLAVTKNPKG